jgi:hypothetical protein
VVGAKDRLFVKLVKVVGGWLWHSDRIDSRTYVVLGYYLGEFIGEKMKGEMGYMAGEVVLIALCG